jgi:hypothetical protein
VITQGELDGAPLFALDALIKEVTRPVKTLDWREFHFFKAQGLSKTDSLATRICLDYEQARESACVRRFVKKLSQDRRQQMLQPRVPFSRYVSVRFSDETASRKVPKCSDVETEQEVLDLPPIPVACVAAPWFPEPWLFGEGSERRKIIKRLEPFYSTRPLAVFEFPLDEEDGKLLLQTAQGDGNTTLHVVAINRDQTKGALRKAFDAWLDRLDRESGKSGFSGTMSRQGKNKFTAALSDLGCYRLMKKLGPQARQDAMNESGFKRSIPKLSEGKARAAKRLQQLRYI